MNVVKKLKIALLHVLKVFVQPPYGLIYTFQATSRHGFRLSFSQLSFSFLET